MSIEEILEEMTVVRTMARTDQFRGDWDGSAHHYWYEVGTLSGFFSCGVLATVSKEAVLESLVLDASCVHYGGGFGEFCDSLGYDRYEPVDDDGYTKPLRVFEACKSIDRGLELLTDWEELIEWADNR